MYLPGVSERYCVSEIYTQRRRIDRRSYAFCLTNMHTRWFCTCSVQQNGNKLGTINSTTSSLRFPQGQFSDVFQVIFVCFQPFSLHSYMRRIKEWQCGWKRGLCRAIISFNIQTWCCERDGDALNGTTGVDWMDPMSSSSIFRAEQMCLC